MANYVSTRIVTDLRDGLPEEQSVVLCMDTFIWALCRDLVYGYGGRDTTFATAYTDAGYSTPDVATMDDIDARIGDFLKEDDLTCDLSELIQQLTDSGCGCSGEKGSWGAGSTEPPASTFEDTGSNFPPGFADRDEYDTYKCETANRIMAGMQRDMDFLAGGTILTLSLTAFFASLFTPIPFDDVATLFGVGVALATQGVLIGAATAVSTLIDDEKEAIVCALFEGTDASDVKGNLNDIWDANLTTTEALLASSMTFFTSVNGLFSKDVLQEESTLTMDVDCANCGGPHFTHLGTDNGDNNWSSEETDPTTHHVAIAFYAQSWTAAIEPTRKLSVELGAMPGFTPKSDATHGYRARPNMDLEAACSGWTVYCTDTKPVGLFCMKKISLRSTTPFSVDLVFGVDC